MFKSAIVFVTLLAVSSGKSLTEFHPIVQEVNSSKLIPILELEAQSVFQRVRRGLLKSHRDLGRWKMSELSAVPG